MTEILNTGHILTIRFTSVKSGWATVCTAIIALAEMHYMQLFLAEAPWEALVVFWSVHRFGHHRTGSTDQTSCGHFCINEFWRIAPASKACSIKAFGAEKIAMGLYALVRRADLKNGK